MDMEEYFDMVYKELEEMISQLKAIGISDYHPRSQEKRIKAVEALEDLKKEFLF
jgi:hypothetical protein